MAESDAIQRKLIVTEPPMSGPDVKAFQLAIKHRLKATGLADQVPVAKHGMFTQATWEAFIEAAYTLGLREDSYLALDHGRGVASKGAQKFVRNPLARTDVQKQRAQERRKHVGPRYLGGGHVGAPIDKILESSNGFQPGHDGVDLICEPEAVLFAICDAEVIDVRPGNWWHLGAQPSHGHPISDGDGIIQLRCTVDAGPFKQGMHFGYGHAEQAVVSVGQQVKAGQRIGRAGFANAWHTHFMVNGGATDRGVGDRDPMPFVEYAQQHAHS